MGRHARHAEMMKSPFKKYLCIIGKDKQNYLHTHCPYLFAVEIWSVYVSSAFMLIIFTSEMLKRSTCWFVSVIQLQRGTHFSSVN